MSNPYDIGNDRGSAPNTYANNKSNNHSTSHPKGQPTYSANPNTYPTGQPTYLPNTSNPSQLEGRMNSFNIELGTNFFSGLPNGLAEGGYPNTNRLKRYFDISQSYVLNKILIILFPFKHKNWKRYNESSLGMSNSVPSTDINAPDLYIPIVSLISFILLRGYSVGLKGQFHPDILGITGLYSIITIFIMVIIVKIISYSFGVGNEVSIIDVGSVLGYNFVNISLVSIISMFCNNTIKNIVRIYVFISMSFFIVRYILNVILPHEFQQIIGQSRRKKLNFLLGIVMFQLLFSFLLTIG
eukprot:GHVP01035945.1.p1 GENE.GHVP01035945.1~~GHVP01035945.1.p1  ORF type:complete len:298 (+),score=13.19 GHVP01035945.1:297-1190(+)